MQYMPVFVLVKHVEPKKIINKQICDTMNFITFVNNTIIHNLDVVYNTNTDIEALKYTFHIPLISYLTLFKQNIS